jgi:hypothetical protein
LAWLSAVLGAACTRDATPASESQPAEHSSGVARMDDGRPRLPDLPSDLQSSFGPLHRAVLQRHEQPLPVLDAAFATAAEHQRWVDEVLQPWLDAGDAIGIEIEATSPELPQTDASASQEQEYLRVHLLHGALSATHFTDVSIVRASIRVPRSLAEDPKTAATAREFEFFSVREARSELQFYRSLCSYGPADESAPSELAAWEAYCAELIENFLVRLCVAESRVHPSAIGDGCRPAS